jgi:hypothetical protein
MKTNIKRLLIIGASSLMLAGCCTTRPVTRWEYKVVHAAPVHVAQGDGLAWQNHHDELMAEWQKDQEALMNSLGKEGWIFVAQSSDYLYFKRPIK